MKKGATPVPMNTAYHFCPETGMVATYDHCYMCNEYNEEEMTCGLDKEVSPCEHGESGFGEL